MMSDKLLFLRQSGACLFNSPDATREYGGSMVQQQRSPEAILSVLVARCGVSRRQAYRYLRQAQSRLEVRSLPDRKSIFTVNLPRPLIRAVRTRCRLQGWRISHVVAELLRQWLEQPSSHG